MSNHGQYFGMWLVDKYLRSSTFLILLVLQNLDHGPPIKFQSHSKTNPKSSVLNDPSATEQLLTPNFDV